MNNAPMIPMTAQEAYRYARDIINGRWPEAEATIATEPEWAYFYAFDLRPDAAGRVDGDPLIRHDDH